MCGIAGIINFKVGRKPEQKALERMIHQLQHRGPDDYGFYIDDQTGLAHARLSIIDIDGGHQPVHDDSNSIWTVFNGEIFNYIELREELIKDGVRFYTQTDTEVIVHLYKKYGLDFANKLNGQFAIALWDTNRSRLLLIRDRVGIVPLFYYKEDRRLFFASEIKSIVPCMKSSPVLNSQGLDQLLSFWSPVSPDTLFENVFEVRPGEMMIIENGGFRHQRYWDWEYPEHDTSHYLQGSVEELAEELHGRMLDATRIRLRSDVPVGAYLSGGLDSSALVSIMHHHGSVDLRTFSIGFEDKKLDESGYQQQLIQHLGTQHSSIVCSSKDISDNFSKTIWHTESTILRTAPTPMMLLSSLVHKNNYKVVLTGEGADEVFGGYDVFKEGKIRQFWAKNRSSKLRPLLLKRLYPYLDIAKSNSRAYLEAFFGIGLEYPDEAGFAHLPRWQTTSRTKAFYSEDMKAKLKESAPSKISALYHRDISAWHSFNRSQYIEARSLMAGYLLSSQGDRMLMANSVEGRFPFLDHNVIEFANKLHPNLKMKVLNEKYLLKQAMKRYLPDEIVNRHKQPYRAPDIPSFFHQHKPDYVDELLSENMIKDYGYFDAKKVSIMQRKIKSGKATGFKDNMSFMAVLSTQMWHYLFVDNFTDYMK